VRDYVEFMHRHRKSADDTAVKLNAYVLSTDLARKRLSDLKRADFEAWLAGALKRRRRTRKKGGEVSQPDTGSKVEVAERSRRRKATLNRVINALKACLNHAASAVSRPTPMHGCTLRNFARRTPPARDG
jgi:hypothetical protein